MEVATLRKVADDTLSKFQEESARLGREVLDLRSASRHATAEFEEFRSRNGLTRPTRQPSNRFLSFSILIAAVVAESGLNGVFFAEGSDAGLLGGVTLAFMISAVNVGLGSFTGFGPVRWLHHRRFARKAIGALLLLLAAVAVLVGNLFVAHYRDTFERVGEALELSAVIASLTSAPFALSRLQSWLLFLTGTFFCCLAVYKGHGFDDPYPDYGAVDRRRLKAQKALADIEAELLDNTTDVRDDCIREISSSIERLRGASAQRQQLLAARARIVADFRAQEDHLAQAYTQLLAEYREANKAARTTPTPARFSERFTFSSSILDRSEMRLLLTEPVATHEAQALIDELGTLISRVLDAYGNLLPKEATSEHA